VARSLMSWRRVVGLSRPPADEENLERLVGELGPPARGFAADLTTPAGVREVVDRTGPVDVLVACAGVAVPDDLTGLNEQALQDAIGVNLFAPAALARGCPADEAARSGSHRVHLLGGRARRLAEQRHGVHELYKTGIGVSTVFPGPVRDAGMFARTEVAPPRGTGTSSPQDVARAVVRAIERDRRAVTVATGGVRLGRVIGVVAPGLVAPIARLAGANRVRAAVVEAEHRMGATTLGG
jgi:short-subunit dehydrogenase